MEMTVKKKRKERKSNIEHPLGARVCVLQRPSGIPFENILLIDSITVLVVVRGGVGGLLTSKRPLSLQAIFNWIHIRYLPSSF